ncbi:MAG: LysM peptidoglycan-binding domain-containing protein [Ruminococcus sp.]|nr:LysM peptidoglycan-binding domain-containing protein [Ruminococcus sp.]
MLRNTPNNESIIVEYGFADSKGDDVNQIKNNWQDLTEAVVKALASYIGVPYTPPAGSNSNYYTIKKGDTLYTIARNYGITVNDLKNANNLANNNLTIGQTLIIPTTTNTSSPNESIYIVKAGDSLYKIANMYNMTVNELKSLNNLSSNLLNIGQKLKVLDNEENEVNTYIVVSGDSLYSIARKFNTTVDALKNANNKTSNLLSIGETLIIPSPTNDNNTTTYTVKKGDTLYSIAQNHNTTVNNIKQLNNLTNNNLSIGMTLKLS